MNERTALVAARRHLVETLAGLAADMAAQAASRCPYRALADRCTFAAGCRNQQRAGPGRNVTCSGGALDPTPARPAGPGASPP